MQTFLIESNRQANNLQRCEYFNQAPSPSAGQKRASERTDDACPALPAGFLNFITAPKLNNSDYITPGRWQIEYMSPAGAWIGVFFSG